MQRPLALGRFQTLEVTEATADRITLRAPDRPLVLPSGEAPPDVRVGGQLRVFIFEGRDGTVQATTVSPVAALGEFACMRCVSVTHAGAYMDWGLPKDLYVPPFEQAQRMEEGRDYVVYVMLDRKGERLIGSTHVATYLDYDVEDIDIDQEVELLVYGRIDAGVQVIVDQRHRGLVHHSDVYGPMKLGTQHTGYVREVRGDNRLDIRLKRRGKAGMLDAQATVLEALEAAGGFLPLHDRSTPAEIEKHLGMSKKAFKRGVGVLYKARTIALRDGGIALTTNPSPDSQE
ncbi:MAG: CvfB family protein [Nannocystales bacterium]